MSCEYLTFRLGGLDIRGKGRHLSPAQREVTFPGYGNNCDSAALLQRAAILATQIIPRGKDHLMIFFPHWHLLYFVWGSECGHWFLTKYIFLSNLRRSIAFHTLNKWRLQLVCYSVPTFQNNFIEKLDGWMDGHEQWLTGDMNLSQPVWWHLLERETF